MNTALALLLLLIIVFSLGFYMGKESKNKNNNDNFLSKEEVGYVISPLRPTEPPKVRTPIPPPSSYDKT
jgi:Na+/H+ antiporter NhaC